jgi:hypothetical protein
MSEVPLYPSSSMPGLRRTYRGTLVMRTYHPLGPYSRPMPMVVLRGRGTIGPYGSPRGGGGLL